MGAIKTDPIAPRSRERTADDLWPSGRSTLKVGHTPNKPQARTFGMAESNVMEIHGKRPGKLGKP
jgi:hypothetical protein